MKIYPEQLNKELQRELKPVYLITGDEILLANESRDAVITAAKTNGFSELETMTTSKGFDWQALSQAAASMSLFSNRQVLELKMTSNKLPEAGKKALSNYLKNPPGDKILLITTNKLEAGVANTSWVKTIEKTAVLVQIWPMQKQFLPRWLTQRLQKNGLKTNHAGIELLIELNEGNLLALAQAIEKLKLLHGETTITSEQIANAISDNAKFDVFKFVDNILAGDKKHSMRILHGLKAEATEPTILVWALARELRNLIKIREDIDKGNNISTALSNHRVWEKRKPLIANALKRLDRNKLHNAISQLATIDRISKGAAKGNHWVMLEKLLQHCTAA